MNDALEDIRVIRTEWMIKAAEALASGNTLSSKGWSEYAAVAADVIEFLEGRQAK